MVGELREMGLGRCSRPLSSRPLSSPTRHRHHGCPRLRLRSRRGRTPWRNWFDGFRMPGLWPLSGSRKKRGDQAGRSRRPEQRGSPIHPLRWMARHTLSLASLVSRSRCLHGRAHTDAQPPFSHRDALRQFPHGLHLCFRRACRRQPSHPRDFPECRRPSPLVAHDSTLPVSAQRDRQCPLQKAFRKEFVTDQRPSGSHPSTASPARRRTRQPVFQPSTASADQWEDKPLAFQKGLL